MDWIDIMPSIGFLSIVFLVTSRIIFLKKKGIQLSSTEKKSVISNGLLYLVFLLIFFFWIFEITKPVFQPSYLLLPETLTNPLLSIHWLKTIGVILIIVALVLMSFTLIHFNNSMRFGLDEKNLAKMITSGVFAISRNPFFLSIELYFTGIVCIFSSMFFLAFWALSIVSIHLFILKEERFLLNNYGDEYLNYKQKVRRYL